MKTNRRSFLGSAAVLPFAAGSLTTAAGDEGLKDKPTAFHYHGRMEPTEVWKPIAKRLAGLREKTGRKIHSIETFTDGSRMSFVRIRTEDGSEGWGQISTYDADISVTVLHRKLAPAVLGSDPADFDGIVDRCIERNYKFPWSCVCRALAGIDTAIWDLLGKLHGKSVCRLLGGKGGALPVYGSSMSRSISPADEGSRLVRLRDEKGFRAFKVRVGRVNGHDRDQRPGRTKALIPTVRKAVGDDVALLADANSCYTPPKAIEVGRLMEDHGYCHFEEPCPYWELEWTAQVAAALKMRVAGGEQDNDLAQWRRMIRMDAVDIVQPDICYVGGLTRALRVAAMAAAAGKACVPHSANLSWVTVFALHMMGAIPNAGPYVELTIENNAWAVDAYEPALAVQDGKVAIPTEPGWGVALRQAWLRKAKHQVTKRS